MRGNALARKLKPKRTHIRIGKQRALFMPFFQPNISLRGRIIRGTAAVCLGIGAALLWSVSAVASVLLAGAALFVAFESVLGWCVLRACGLKTKF